MRSHERAVSGQPAPGRGIARFLVLLCLALPACASHPRTSGADIAARLGPAAPLLPLYRALGGLEDGTRTKPLVILQIGDSHTANDSFSGRLRERFQGRFGDAGRGVLHPGIPFNYYRPDRVSVDAGGWTVERAGRSAVPTGIAAVTQHAAGPADMTLSAADPADMASVSLEFLYQPGGGTVDIATAAGWHRRVPTNAASAEPRWVDVPNGSSGSEVTVSALGDGPVDMLSWSAERDRRGVIVANLGTIGATVDILGRMDPALVRRELAHIAPDVILLAFGTNEGFDNGTDTATYRTRFEQGVDLLRAAAPGAAIVVLGPPDGARRTRRGSTGRTACGDPRWNEPAGLAVVRDVQRDVAARERLFFWDWQAAMGGPCSMDRWAAMSPPMAAADHVHMLRPGYQATADALFRALMEGYETYRTPRPIS